MYRLVLVILSLFYSTVAVAADEKSADATDMGVRLAVVIDGLTDEQLIDNAKAFLELYSENNKVVKNPSYISYLAGKGTEQIQHALQPYGYYQSHVTVDTQKTVDRWTITYRVDKGKPTRVTAVNVAVTGEGQTQAEYQKQLEKYPLAVGDILQQTQYTTFKDDLMALATTYGYFDAQFTEKQIVLSDDLLEADITVNYDTGQRYIFGNTTIKQDFLDDDVFRRFLTYNAGDAYSSSAIADVQRDLYNSDYVKTIDVTAVPETADKQVPVALAITPKRNKKHTFSLGYGTDTGPRAKYRFDWRWLNRRGHQFNSELYASQDTQEAEAEYRIPAAKPATDYYKLFAKVTRDQSGSNDSLTWGIGGAYHDQIGNLTREIGLKWQQENFTLGNDSGNIGLLTPYGSLTYRKVDDPINIARGFWLRGELAGGHTALLSETTFLQAVASAKRIRKFGDKHKVKLASAIGKTWTDDFHQLPPSYRFFTGGDRTVRGYSFDSIGDTDSSGTTIGGDKMYYASAEYEYFFNDTMAAAVFIDAGDAFSGSDSRTKVGAGVGFHYYSPIGPIRIDVAHGFQEPGDEVRLHLSIGPEL